jgi:hypothetical protein
MMTCRLELILLVTSTPWRLSFRNFLTNFMKQNPCWEADSPKTCQKKFLPFLCEPNVHYRLHNSMPFRCLLKTIKRHEISIIAVVTMAVVTPCILVYKYPWIQTQYYSKTHTFNACNQCYIFRFNEPSAGIILRKI